MASKHTPGPWAVSSNSTLVYSKKPEGTGRWIADMGSVPRLDPEDLANARLIAAAPDLLEALKHIDAHGYVTLDDFDMVRAAIAKAEGRG